MDERETTRLLVGVAERIEVGPAPVDAIVARGRLRTRLLRGAGAAAVVAAAVALGATVLPNEGRVVSDALTTSSQAPEGMVAAGAVSWSGALVNTSDNGLTLSFIGAPAEAQDEGCAESYSAAVRETADQVSVTIHRFTRSPDGTPRSCLDVGTGRQITVQLSEPLEGRTLRDGSDGQTRTPFRQRDLLSAIFLPPGTEEQPSAATGGDASWTRLFDGEAAAFVITQARTAPSPAAEGVAVARPDINGSRGTLYELVRSGSVVRRAVAWEGPTGFVRVDSTGGRGQGPLAADDLLEVARGLRASK
jgi:hypothetical protein